MIRLLTDIAGPFYDPGRPFRNWSTLPFYQLDLPQPPYVDQQLLERGVARATAYLAQVAAQGYNGIVVDNLAHLVSFDAAPERVYAVDDPCRLRALAYGESFARLFRAAAAQGMAVFVTSDMQWATPGLRRYAGRLHPGNRRLAAANRWALEELFSRFPEVGGIVVRVGEAGGAHDQGRCYTGHLLYRTVADLRRLIDTLLPVCERHDRLLVVRTWSLGIGAVGDLHWSAERYHAVFGGYRSPHMLVSLKYGPSDFFRHLPPNPTLGLPGPAQIVELQNRREYELFGMAPSGIAALHRRVLTRVHRSGQTVGVWAWNSLGGWGGGHAALGEMGWSLWTELSSALTAFLARDPAGDAAAFVRAWCAARFTAEQGFAEAIAAFYLASEQLIEHGWYAGPLRDEPASIAGIALPTLLWVWWLRPTGAPLIWACLAAAIPNVAVCLAQGSAALERLDHHVARLAATAPREQVAAGFVVESARYMRSCLAVAMALRELLLPAFVAAHQGDRVGWQATMARLPATRGALTAHRLAWSGRDDFPALELDEVEAYLGWLQSAPDPAWAQARLMALLARRLLGSRATGRQLRALGVGATLLAAIGAWRSARSHPALAGLLTAGLLALPLRRPALRIALPWLSQRFFLLPSIFFETGPAFTEWAP